MGWPIAPTKTAKRKPRTSSIRCAGRMCNRHATTIHIHSMTALLQSYVHKYVSLLLHVDASCHVTAPQAGQVRTENFDWLRHSTHGNADVLRFAIANTGHIMHMSSWFCTVRTQQDWRCVECTYQVGTPCNHQWHTKSCHLHNMHRNHGQSTWALFWHYPYDMQPTMCTKQVVSQHMNVNHCQLCTQGVLASITGSRHHCPTP